MQILRIDSSTSSIQLSSLYDVYYDFFPLLFLMNKVFLER